MKLATLRTASGTQAVRVDDDRLIEIGSPDVGALLAMPDWQQRYEKRHHASIHADGKEIMPSRYTSSSTRAG